MLERIGHIHEPQQLFNESLPALCYFTFDHAATYLSHPETRRLQVLCNRTADSLLVSLFERPDIEPTSTDVADHEYFQKFIQDHDLPCLNVTAPWPLSTVRIAKPWGAEIWYTGIEARGVCTVSGMPLPWLTDLLPESIIGQATGSAPLLLKILDPLPDQSLGDLYFELHEKKIEVYVVTQVDRQAWPDGIGKIRYGFNQELRKTFASDDQFRKGYLDAVTHYQQVRNQIDEFLNQSREAADYSASAEVPANLMQSWLQKVPAELAEQEAARKAEMNQFTALRDISVGDVITVDPFFPHSLQHGVRVIEFQTASYERYILSFGQKVLTQNHWDTEVGVAEAILDLPNESALRQLAGPEGVTIELIADFSAFKVIRITITPGHGYGLGNDPDYKIVIGVSGAARLDGVDIKPERALLLPIDTRKGSQLSSITGAVLLIAQPKP